MPTLALSYIYSFYCLQIMYSRYYNVPQDTIENIRSYVKSHTLVYLNLSPGWHGWSNHWKLCKLCNSLAKHFEGHIQSELNSIYILIAVELFRKSFRILWRISLLKFMPIDFFFHLIIFIRLLKRRWKFQKKNWKFRN